MTIGAISFAFPWLLLGLLALPVLWVILRAVPPAAIRLWFPALVLLLGLRDETQITQKTPWWLLLLRTLAVAALILGLAGPFIGPKSAVQSEPTLFVVDDGWPAARDWSIRMEELRRKLNELGRAGERAAIFLPAKGDLIPFQPAASLATMVSGFEPQPWLPKEDAAGPIQGLANDKFEVVWFSDGSNYVGRDAIISALASDLTVYETQTPLYGLLPPSYVDGKIQIGALRQYDTSTTSIQLEAHGTDPAGNPLVLADVTATFADETNAAQVELTLPSELRSRITHITVADQRTAGTISITADTLRRREVALFSNKPDQEALQLLSPLYYLTKALAPTADILEGDMATILPANPDMIILSDVAKLPSGVAQKMMEWVENGGLLVRFAGPSIASLTATDAQDDPLMPVRLRSGGRSVSGAMSWNAPRTLAPFAENSPFFGLTIPDEVTVTTQILAQPDPDLSEYVIAALDDGTPLVTRKRIGQGQVVLFHVTANTEWSSLPLSGIFVQMLERLAQSTGAQITEGATEFGNRVWQPIQVVTAFGSYRRADDMAGVTGEMLGARLFGPDLLPGLYSSQDASVALNAVTSVEDIAPAKWPNGVKVRGFEKALQQELGGWLLFTALGFLLVDAFASLAVSGRWRGAQAMVIVAALMFMPDVSQAQTVPLDRDIAAANEVTFGYILTGDARMDDISRAGIYGLAQIVWSRTSVEPADPNGLDLEKDELSFYPLIYWPITTTAPMPSAAAFDRINAYLRGGGVILFDTRDGDISSLGSNSKTAVRLREIASNLVVPPLEPVPEDHVLTRAFYLLQEFPGRSLGSALWVEAAPPDAAKVEGVPFRDLNDGVSPVIIGGNDWAAAWALDPDGLPIYPVGYGLSGERQREMAYRFGVNLVMYVLTGNYKSDQVHVPALLDRLGQ